MSCQPGPEALTWSDPTSTQKPPDSLTGLGQRNRVTAISEERSQTSYQRCSGKVQKGSPAPLTCVHRRLSGMLFQLGVLGAPSSRRPEVCSKLGGPGAENLEVRLEAGEPRPSWVRPLHARPGSFTASGDRCSRSLRRPLCQGGRRALVRNHYRNEFALLFTKQSCHQKRSKITTYHTLS